jgi:hypothetical protein
MLITSCVQKREIKLWQSVVDGEGRYDVQLFRSFDLDAHIKPDDGIDVQFVAECGNYFMDCTPNFDGTKLVVGVQINWWTTTDAHRVGCVMVFDIHSGESTIFLKSDFSRLVIGGLTACKSDNKFAVLFDDSACIWNIDMGVIPQHRFRMDSIGYNPFWFSHLLYLHGDDSTLIRGCDYYLTSYKLEEGSELWKKEVRIISGLSILPSICRLAMATPLRLLILETQFWTHIIEWKIPNWCSFIEFCPSGRELLTLHPAGNCAMFIWNPLTGEQLRSLSVRALQSFRWCEPGKIMVSQEGTSMMIWDSASGEEVCRWNAHEAPAKACGSCPVMNILM